MSVAKILKEQSAWLDRAAKMMVLDRATPQDARFTDEERERRRQQIEARIAALESQRDAAVKRFEGAIAEAKAEIEQLRAEFDPNKRLADVFSDGSATKPQPKRAKGARASAKARPGRGK